jgi:DGQHR domain-containing protein
MNREKIVVTDGPTLRSGIKTVVGSIPVEELVKRGVIPYHKPNSNDMSGYQRNPQQTRVNELAVALQQNNVDLPTAVLLSIRMPWESVIDRDGGKRRLDLSEIEKVYIVDGQHRFLAFAKVMEDARNEGTESFNLPPKIPFVCMIGADETHEMEQFHVVNSKSRPVSTDLSLKLLKERAENDVTFRKYLEAKDRVWKVDAQNIVEMLAKTSRIWEGRIRLPNMAKKETTAPSPSMVTSLQPVVKGSHYFREAPIEKQVQLLNAYWGGIRKVVPEAFFTGKPKGENGFEKYAIQKGVCVRGLHGIFVSVMEIVRQNGGSLYSEDDYAKVLKDPLLGISGNNGWGDITAGKDFWLAGKDGCAASYSSGVAIRTLTKMLERLLPKPNYQDN